MFDGFVCVKDYSSVVILQTDLDFVKPSFHRVLNVSDCVPSVVERVRVYLDDTCDTVATIWKLGFNKLCERTLITA